MVSAFQQSSELTSACESCPGGGTQRMGAIAQDQVIITNTEITNKVAPDGTVSLSFNVQNNAGFINPLDNDLCISKNGTAGYKMTATVTDTATGNQVDSFHLCTAEDGGLSRKLTASFQAPATAGTYSVSITVKGETSGLQTSDSPTTLQYTVTSTASGGSQSPPGSTPTCPSGFTLQNGQCVSTSSGSGGSGSKGVLQSLLGGLVPNVSISPFTLLAAGGAGALFLLLALRGVGL